jgi:hypothetical protein
MSSLKIWLFSIYVPAKVSAEDIPNSTVGIFSPKTVVTKTNAARVLISWVTTQI